MCSTSYRKLEKRKTQIAFLIAKQRKAPPSPSSLGLWSTSSSNSPIRKIKSMPRSRLEVSIDDFSDTSDDTKLLNPGLTNDQFPRPVS
ncbi:8728_t:CDS:2 [Rhizophagus irregularis]|nr:8728_t:CDS:2 [Rhizophagus irregularis]